MMSNKKYTFSIYFCLLYLIALYFHFIAFTLSELAAGLKKTKKVIFFYFDLIFFFIRREKKWK